MPEQIELSTIRVFIAVAQAGSVSAGSRRVGLTRSAAGKAVSRLEERLETRLLHRTTRSVSLTMEGRLFLERAEQILIDLDDAEAAVRQDAREPSGTLRLTLPETFGRVTVLPLLHSFLKRWPAMQADVSLTDRHVDIVAEGFDLAVRCGAELTDTRMIARVVARSRTVVCASPDYLAASGEPRDVDELMQHSRITFGVGDATRPWLIRSPDGSALRVNKRGRLHLDSGSALRDAAADGLGVACLPMFLVDADIAAGRLVPLLTDHSTEDLLIHALYPHRRHLAAKVRLFVDHIVEGRTDRASTTSFATL